MMKEKRDLRRVADAWNDESQAEKDHLSFTVYFGSEVLNISIRDTKTFEIYALTVSNAELSPELKSHRLIDSLSIIHEILDDFVNGVKSDDSNIAIELCPPYSDGKDLFMPDEEKVTKMIKLTITTRFRSIKDELVLKVPFIKEDTIARSEEQLIRRVEEQMAHKLEEKQHIIDGLQENLAAMKKDLAACIAMMPVIHEMKRDLADYIAMMPVMTHTCSGSLSHIMSTITTLDIHASRPAGYTASGSTTCTRVFNRWNKDQQMHGGFVDFDVKKFKYLTELRELTISGNQFKDLSFLYNCRKLQNITLINMTDLVSIQTLTECPVLTRVEIKECCNVRDLDSLNQCPKLTHLIVPNGTNTGMFKRVNFDIKIQ